MSNFQCKSLCFDLRGSMTKQTNYATGYLWCSNCRKVMKKSQAKEVNGKPRCFCCNTELRRSRRNKQKIEVFRS